MTAPDLTQKALGYRLFRMSDRQLGAVGISPQHFWQPGVNHARCYAGVPQGRGYAQLRAAMVPSLSPAYYLGHLGHVPQMEVEAVVHRAPDASCRCGLYAFHAMPPAWERGGLLGSVGAAVLAWGRTQVHPEGFRAEYAEIALLTYDPSSGPNFLDELKDTAARYHVPLVPIEEFHERAKELGEVIPQSLMPEEPSPMSLEEQQYHMQQLHRQFIGFGSVPTAGSHIVAATKGLYQWAPSAPPTPVPPLPPQSRRWFLTSCFLAALAAPNWVFVVISGRPISWVAASVITLLSLLSFWYWWDEWFV